MSELDSDSPESLPTAQDGYHEPTEKMKRGSRYTALAIVAFLVFWILLGLRHAFFGS